MSVWEACELFLCSVEECQVNRGNSRLLVEGKGSPEIVPSHSESEAEGTILDLLKNGDVSLCSEREGKWAIGKKRKNESFVEVKFCFYAAVAKSLQVA